MIIRRIFFLSIFLLGMILISCSASEKIPVKKPKVQKKANKQVALTFDDLPFATNNEFLKDAEKKRLFTKFLDALKKYNIKITGFLIGNRYDSSWYPYLKRFIEEGHTLGNHTFSHFNSNDHSPEEYINNIERCDSLLREILKKVGADLNMPAEPSLIALKKEGKEEKTPLLYPSPALKDKEKIKEILFAKKENLEKISESKINRNWRYFRYPYLNRGETERKKLTIISVLENSGYKIAPVTITSNDWRFNPRFELAYINGMTKELEELKGLYISRIKRELYNSEDYSLVTFHRHVKHIMLFHLNVINSLLIEDILDLLVNSGYEFIGLDEALTDEIYNMVDGYSGSYGVPWLYRAKRVRIIK